MQLQYFRDLGFSIDHLVDILAHHGGSHNLAALQALVEKKITYTKDEATLTVTQLQYFRDVGFSIDHLVGILANIGGSYNLAALQKVSEKRSRILKMSHADRDAITVFL